MFWDLLIGGTAAGAIWAGFALGGFRGAAIVAFIFALLWVSVRVARSYEAEAELAAAKTDLAAANEAFDHFRTQSEVTAAYFAAKIAAIEAARAEAEAALNDHRQRSAAKFEALKRRISSHVPDRRDCDYRQPVLDGLRDAYRAAAE